MRKMIQRKYYQKISLFVIIISIFLINSPNVIGSAEPILKNHQLPAQSWTFIEEVNFTENVLVNYEWRSNIEVQGVGVTKTDYQYMLGLGLIERSEYFEQLNYFEGLTDSGKLTTNDNGSVYFIFFNPETSQASLTITYEYRTNLLEPWAIGLIATVVTVIVLSIAFYYAIKLRNRMIHEAIDAAEAAENDSPERRYLG